MNTSPDGTVARWTRFIASAASVLICSTAVAQDLGTAIRTALSDSPAVKRAVASASAAGSDVDMVRSARLPRVIGDASSGPAKRDRSVDGLSSGTGEFRLSRRATLSVQQLLFDWGHSRRLVEAAELRHQFEDLLVEEAKEDVALIVAGTYLDLMRYRRRHEILREKVEFLEDLRQKAEERAPVEGNTDSIILAGRIATAKSDRAEFRGLAEAMETRFLLLTTLKPGELEDPPVPPNLETDRTNSPSYRAAVVAKGVSEANTEALRKEFLPKLFVEVTGGLGEDVLGIDGPDNEFSALVVARWNLFEGGRKRAAVAKAMAEEDRDQAAIEDVVETIDDRVGVAQARLRAARDRYDELKKSIDDLRKAVKSYEERLEAGDEKVRIMPLVSILTEQNKAEGELVDADVERFATTYEVLAVSGRLRDFFDAK